jgi:hypothetical protein
MFSQHDTVLTIGQFFDMYSKNIHQPIPVRMSPRVPAPQRKRLTKI